MLDKKSIAFYASAVCFLLSSVCILLMPLTFSEDNSGGFAAYLLGGLFWGLLLCGIAIQVALYKIRPAVVKEKVEGKAFFSIGSNRISAVFEAIFAVSILFEIFNLIMKFGIEWLDITLIFCMIFSFEMHCIFVTDNYKQIEHKLLGGK